MTSIEKKNLGHFFTFEVTFLGLVTWGGGGVQGFDHLLKWVLVTFLFTKVGLGHFLFTAASSSTVGVCLDSECYLTPPLILQMIRLIIIIIMDDVVMRLIEFNARSIDPKDHLRVVLSDERNGKSCASYCYLCELRMCSEHPAAGKCFVSMDRQSVRVEDHGLTSGGCGVKIRGMDCLEQVFMDLHLIRERSRSAEQLLEWEMEDWVGSGNACRLHGMCVSPAVLEFEPEALWCVDCHPRMSAKLLLL